MIAHVLITANAFVADAVAGHMVEQFDAGAVGLVDAQNVVAVLQQRE